MKVVREKNRDYIMIPGDKEDAVQFRRSIHEMMKALSHLPGSGIDYTPLFTNLLYMVYLLEAFEPDCEEQS